MYLILLLILIIVLSRKSVTFVDAPEMYEIVRTDPYFQHMSSYDIEARHVRSVEDYKISYARNIQRYTENEKKIIKQTVNLAAKILRPFKNISRIPCGHFT